MKKFLLITAVSSLSFAEARADFDVWIQVEVPQKTVRKLGVELCNKCPQVLTAFGKKSFDDPNVEVHRFRQLVKVNIPTQFPDDNKTTLDIMCGEKWIPIKPGNSVIVEANKKYRLKITEYDKYDKTFTYSWSKI